MLQSRQSFGFGKPRVLTQSGPTSDPRRSRKQTVSERWNSAVKQWESGTLPSAFETWRTITQCARSSNDCGMVMPSAFAVLRVDTQVELRDEGGDVMKNSRDYSSRYFICSNALGAATRVITYIVI